MLYSTLNIFQRGNYCLLPTAYCLLPTAFYYSTPNFFQQLGTGAVKVITSLVVGCSKVIDRQWRAIPSGNFCREPYL